MLTLILTQIAMHPFVAFSGDDGFIVIVVFVFVIILHLFQSKCQIQAEHEFDRLKQEWLCKKAGLETFLDSPEYVGALNKAADTLAVTVKETASPRPNHKLPLSVADEINRMRVRLEKMEEDDIKVKPLTKALERLEEKLNELGYEIVDLKGKPYTVGMTAKCQFVTVDSLEEDEQKITRVITPQVMFSGKVIQAPEIEVSTGMKNEQN